jgi:mannose-6-phosphate isomerase-like protein (cupin superfamily)
LLQLDPSVSIAQHEHATSSEDVLVLSGSGYWEMRGRSYPIAGGELIHVEPGVRHGYTPAGSEPLALVALHTPPGPERLFVEGAALGLAGPPHVSQAKVAR